MEAMHFTHDTGAICTFDGTSRQPNLFLGKWGLSETVRRTVRGGEAKPLHCDRLRWRVEVWGSRGTVQRRRAMSEGRGGLVVERGLG